MDVGPKRKGYFPDIVFLQIALFHFCREHVRHRVEGGRLARAEIFGELPGAGAYPGKNEIEDPGLHESVIDVAFHHGEETVLNGAAQPMGLDMRKKFGEFAVGDGVEKRFAAGEVVIDGHGSDADDPGDAAHADGFGPLFFEDRKSHLGDALSGAVCLHLYSV